MQNEHNEKECCGKCDNDLSKSSTPFINSQKMSFYLGLAIGVAMISLIGFVVLLMRGRGTDNFVNVDKVADINQPVKNAPLPNIPPEAPKQIAKLRPSDHILGDKKAPITIIEYSDFECPFCKRFHPTMKELVKANDGKIKWVYRHFPLSFHANAQKEAEATECANKLGGNKAFWAYTDAIFEKTTSGGTGLALEALVPIAKELGLNTTKFKKCLDSGEFADYVKQDMALGAAEGITGTPGNILIKKDGTTSIISGAVSKETLQASIDSALKEQ